MMQKEKHVKLLAKTETTNAYNEIVKTWSYLKYVDVILSCRSVNTALANEEYHNTFVFTGLTYDAAVRADDKLQDGDAVFLVKDIVETGRRRMMTLERVKAV